MRALFLCVLLAASQAAHANGPINKCTLPNGRVMMTDRPCGDPATERRHARPADISAREISADDVFTARQKIGKPPLSPELIDSRGIPDASGALPGQTKSGD